MQQKRPASPSTPLRKSAHNKKREYPTWREYAQLCIFAAFHLLLSFRCQFLACFLYVHFHAFVPPASRRSSVAMAADLIAPLLPFVYVCSRLPLFTIIAPFLLPVKLLLIAAKWLFNVCMCWRQELLNCGPPLHATSQQPKNVMHFLELSYGFSLFNCAHFHAGSERYFDIIFFFFYHLHSFFTLHYHSRHCC